MKPVVIMIGGSTLDTWTEMTLSRTKDEMTGTLEVSIFAGAMPPSPSLTAARAGAEIQCYIAGALAFTGTIDKRKGSGTKHGKEGTDDNKEQSGGSMSATIGPNEYTIKLSARGKTKRLMDASHQHETTNMMQPKTKEVCEKLVKPFKTQLEWKAEDIKLDKIRFRDGGRVSDELHRVAQENGYFMYETRDGKLRVTDGVGGSGGDPLILGRNILTFNAEQSEDQSKSEIKVKGQRSKKEEWGEKALLKTFKEIKDSSTKGFVPLTVQHYGDSDDKTLERRGRFEANKRSAESKKITIEVFHVQTPSGQPWDIGNTHYVEVPPEGIFETFECIELSYHVNADKELKTTLTLSPPPSGGTGGSGGGGGGGGGSGGVSAAVAVMSATVATTTAPTTATVAPDDYSNNGGGYGLDTINTTIGETRRAQAGIAYVEGQYPDPWVGPQLVEMPFMTLAEKTIKKEKDEQEKEQEEEREPPLQLPQWFGDLNE